MPRDTDAADDESHSDDGGAMGAIERTSSSSGSTGGATPAGGHDERTDYGRLQSIMDEASEALVNRRYFDCERLANKALHDAWVAQEYELLARICMPLQEARRQRRLLAADSGQVVLLDSDLPSLKSKLSPGCYVIAPPNVGADARRLAEAAFEQQVPVIAFACEPVTQAGLLPLVVIGPTTIRTKVPSPGDFSPTWCLNAIEALEKQALSQIDEGRSLDRQVDDLVDLLDALPESEEIHIILARKARSLGRDAADSGGQ
ncbi:MAG: hypothetical protein ACOC0P_05800 [Planctomycetota bacterium]